MRSSRLQHAQFVRKREAEQLKIEKSAAVHNYFDKWSKITPVYENWTNPEYYKDAEENYRKKLQKEEHQKSLSGRQSMLKQMLDEEEKGYEREIKERSRPKVKQVPNNVLEDLRQTFNNVEESKRRSDLESRLYSKWRLGLDQEKVLKESKNEHEAMAKLSWLDRQVEKQMTQEKEKRENNEIELKLQENKRKHEEYLKNCKEMRDSEMQQLKGLQENHVFELKSRERESHDLKLQESILRKKLGEIKKEIDNISTNGRVRRDRVVAMYNYRKLKMVLQSRSEAIQRELRQDINLLDRISFDKDFDNNEEISYLRQKFNTQLENEIQNQRDIESMYESEAKQTLAKQEEKWNDDSMVREQQLKCLLESRIEAINDLINHSMKRQQEIIGVRESHLKSIEESNDRLKKLMTETISDDFNCLTNGHSNEMKDVCKKTDNLMIRQNTELCLPKFGRKRIVWT